MRQFLKIENPGVAPAEAFTMLGVSLKGLDQLPDNLKAMIIGQFGSGAKHAINVCLRAGVSPTIYCSNLCLEFGTEEATMESDHKAGIYQKVYVKFSGRKDDGKTKNSTQDLWGMGYGAIDWTAVSMALREWVSNAIDHAIAYNHYNDSALLYPWDGVKIELVDENQVRAKTGTTRIFIPATHPEIRTFFVNYGKFFLHFSEPKTILENKQILPKTDRNQSNDKRPVFYRRGVLVGEYPTNIESLFDYNLPNLKIDEARNLSEYTARAEAAQAIRNCDHKLFFTIVRSFDSGNKYFEHGFDGHYMKIYYEEDQQKKQTEEWGKALEMAGENAVLSDKASAETLKRKGYNPIIVPDGYLETATKAGLRTCEKVLSKDERDGITILPATQAVQDNLDKVWKILTEINMTNGKDKPPVHCFNKIMEAESQWKGFYRAGEVYIHEVYAQNETLDLTITMIEELGHHITGATDNSRDLQDWAFSVIGRII